VREHKKEIKYSNTANNNMNGMMKMKMKKKNTMDFSSMGVSIKLIRKTALVEESINPGERLPVYTFLYLNTTTNLLLMMIF
jgi:hypothetical protein